MAKKLSASSQRAKRVAKSAADILAYTKTAAYKRETARLKSKKDSDIDFSDIPELTDEQLARMVRALAPSGFGLNRLIFVSSRTF